MKFTFSSGICQLGLEDEARNGVVKIWGEAILIKYSRSRRGNSPTVRRKAQGVREYLNAECGMQNAECRTRLPVGRDVDEQYYLGDTRRGMMQNTPSIM